MYIVGLELPREFTGLKDTTGYKYVEYLYAHLTLKSLDEMLGEQTIVPTDLKEKLTDNIAHELVNKENFKLMQGSVLSLIKMNYVIKQPYEKGFNVDEIISSTLESLIEELHEQPKINEIGELLASTEVVERLEMFKLFLTRIDDSTELTRYALNHSRKYLNEFLLQDKRWYLW